MTIINMFLQRSKLRENSHGVLMVIAAYALSVLLLVIGSDTLYNITSRANGSEAYSNEENQEIDNTYEIAVQDKEIYLTENSKDYLHKYQHDYSQELNQSAFQKVSVSDDTNWFLGMAMTDEEFDRLLANMKDNEIFRQVEQNETKENLSAKDSLDTPVIKITEEEISMLERIVEAEASGEDMIGKILVANVILNRLADDKFPDTVKDVIFQKSGDGYQFSPISNKRYWKVKVSNETKEAVQRALNGEDYSQGALYFIARKIAKKSSVKWFDNNLKWLFKHGGHEFYR